MTNETKTLETLTVDDCLTVGEILYHSAFRMLCKDGDTLHPAVFIPALVSPLARAIALTPFDEREKAKALAIKSLESLTATWEREESMAEKEEQGLSS